MGGLAVVGSWIVFYMLQNLSVVSVISTSMLISYLNLNISERHKSRCIFFSQNTDAFFQFGFY